MIELNKNVRHTVAHALLCCVTLLSVQGCVGIMVGGAVVGTLAATDRRTVGAQTEDKAITVKAEVRVPNISGGGHVNIASFNRKVLLTGEVSSEAIKASVEREVAAIEGVQSVVNELAILGNSGFTARSSDTVITGKVKASFVDNKTLSANAIKVVTERGEVFLMGRVTQNEGNLAAEITRGVSGVTKVVKVFEYISDDEYRQLNTTPASTQNK